MMHAKNLLLALLMIAPAVTATPALARSKDPTADCYAEATTDAEKQACIGLTSTDCRKRKRNPQVNDLAICMDREIQWWRARLSDAEEAMRTRAEERDKPYAKQIAGGAAKMTDDLDKMIESWNKWEQMRCNFESMFYRSSPRRMLHAQECHMTETAKQAILLESSAAR
ncbi:uncharacterized protein DUF1311 [Rhodobacter aestuarii]|uniref:Lysozyme inhibitor LprI-like N-terminal domain-containing protein n=1 Tax=Rhodobacter aestuarii TaxID=453582 RepID=A0A1N7MLS8_9RHOB|nr:lysozyme inhibitor LprI family protein [Rhodobacter aestuarii]PTV96671.1 uncharacterized protein DUF1311 [Rhodobacter aestuarii]SIS87057.1 Protein of unknown function [Rhodobacter aestuarii]